MASSQIPVLPLNTLPVDTNNVASAVVRRDTDKSINVGAVNCTTLALATAAKSSAYTLAEETVIVVTGITTLTLPAASSSAGKLYVIVKKDATNTLTIDPNGSETINGSATSITSTTQWAVWRLFCDGTEWYSI